MAEVLDKVKDVKRISLQGDNYAITLMSNSPKMSFGDLCQIVQQAASEIKDVVE